MSLTNHADSAWSSNHTILLHIWWTTDHTNGKKLDKSHYDIHSFCCTLGVNSLCDFLHQMTFKSNYPACWNWTGTQDCWPGEACFLIYLTSSWEQMSFPFLHVFSLELDFSIWQENELGIMRHSLISYLFCLYGVCLQHETASRRAADCVWRKTDSEAFVPFISW